MKIKVLFFASYRDLTGTRQVHIDIENNSKIRDLKRILVEMFPEMRTAINTALFSIDKEFAFEEDIIRENAEVGVFPPVSGGYSDQKTNFFAVVEEKIDLNDCLARITSESIGAACIFSGMVRGLTFDENFRRTEYLEYEAYRSMAELKLEQVCGEIRNRWPSIEKILVIQRIGHLEPGEPTVVVACSAAHRNTGVFDAAKFGIDRLKEIVPIWKKEVGPEGEIWIKGSYTPNSHDKS